MGVKITGGLESVLNITIWKLEQMGGGELENIMHRN